MKRVRHFLRNFTATAVKEHLRSEIETTGGPPDLTKNEIELVRFIYDGSFDWRVSGLALKGAKMTRMGGVTGLAEENGAGRLRRANRCSHPRPSGTCCNC